MLINIWHLVWIIPLAGAAGAWMQGMCSANTRAHERYREYSAGYKAGRKARREENNEG